MRCLEKLAGQAAVSRFGASQGGYAWQLRPWGRDTGVSTTNASDCLRAFFGGLCEVCYLDDGIEQMRIHITELSGRIGTLVIHSNIRHIRRTILIASNYYVHGYVRYLHCLARSMKHSLPSGKAMSPTRTLQLLEPCLLHSV